ncbi:MAG: GNAT family N-acetyltransferase [Candidatus Pacebacteria bacterium]|nr:GNAT family N-acetyltransferase [Candidatus Paceibacterota bacterium]
MTIQKAVRNNIEAIRFTVEEGEKVVGWAYLYLIYNSQHEEPYGLLEDVYVDPAFRSKGLGTELVKAVIEEARVRKCYKLIGTSRHSRTEVHEWYKKIGFADYGLEFRMNLK